MKFDIPKIRKRLVDGEGTPEDYTWTKNRLQVLEGWPDELSWDQKAEVQSLTVLLSEQVS